MSTRRWLIVAALLTASLVAMVADKQYTLHAGREVVLQLALRDPRDLFRGDYVDLDYEISRLTPARLEGDVLFERRDTLYLRLSPPTADAPQDAPWKAAGIYHEWPQAAPGEVVLRGTVDYVPRWNVIDKATGLYDLDVTYGIESYFVPEGEGKDLERLPREAEVRVRVAVDGRGKAGILGILIDGKEYAREALF